jgi:hypothetical protein
MQPTRELNHAWFHAAGSGSVWGRGARVQLGISDTLNVPANRADLGGGMEREAQKHAGPAIAQTAGPCLHKLSSTRSHSFLALCEVSLSVLALSSTRASRLALCSLASTLRMFLIALYFDPFRVVRPAHPVGSESADVDRSLLRSTLRLALGSPEPPCSQLAHLVRPVANRRSLLRQPAFLLSALIHSTLALDSPEFSGGSPVALWSTGLIKKPCRPSAEVVIFARD